METANRHHANRPSPYRLPPAASRRPGLCLAFPVLRLLACVAVLSVAL